MQTHTRDATLPRRLFALVPVIAAVTLVVGPGGGHPSLGGVLIAWAASPTLAAYLSRALEGSDFPSPLFIVLGSLEYPLVGYGVGSLVAHVRPSSASRPGILLLVAYIAAQLAAHVVLNQQAVNLRLLADANHAVSDAAVGRIAASGDSGAVKTAYLRDEDIARLSAALASRLAEVLEVTPDSDASLTLIAVMNGQRDLCAKYFVLVPNGLRDRPNVELARVLTAIKQGQSPDRADVFFATLAKEDIIRLQQEPAAVADEWISWAASEAAPCHVP
jgi:hypothetical protein